MIIYLKTYRLISPTLLMYISQCHESDEPAKRVPNLCDAARVYGPDLMPGRPAGESRARYVGTQSDLALMWQRRGAALRIAYSAFWPRRFIQETGSAEVVHVFAPRITLSF